MNRLEVRGLIAQGTGDTDCEALIDDDYTSGDNIAFEMLQAGQRVPITMAVANLYLRKQIIFERAKM